MIWELPDKATMTAFPFRKAHFIGLAGVGMSATAILLRDSDVAVTGSDEAIYTPISQVLAREQFACRAPYAARNIPDDADLIVIGKNARLVPNENEEVAEAFTRAARPGGPKILSFAEVLALLSRGHENIVVAGSFGKTTSVSMMAHCLASAGLDPTWMIGAVPLSPARASNAGTGRFFLLEGDEYPSSNTDNQSKFLHYRPAHVLLAPLAHDHVNVFPTIESYLAPFHQLFDLVARDGLIVAATSGELSERFLAEAKRDVVTFGLSLRRRTRLSHRGHRKKLQEPPLGKRRCSSRTSRLSSIAPKPIQTLVMSAVILPSARSRETFSEAGRLSSNNLCAAITSRYHRVNEQETESRRRARPPPTMRAYDDPWSRYRVRRAVAGH
jgi:UDP-N-acetylmuramate-alanine ligase